MNVSATQLWVHRVFLTLGRLLALELLHHLGGAARLLGRICFEFLHRQRRHLLPLGLACGGLAVQLAGSLPGVAVCERTPAHTQCRRWRCVCCYPLLRRGGALVGKLLIAFLVGPCRLERTLRRGVTGDRIDAIAIPQGSDKRGLCVLV